MPISNTRITPVVGTTIEKVIHPNHISIEWHPHTGGGDIRFEFLENLVVDGVVDAKDFGRHGHVRRMFNEIKNVKPAYAGLVDPVTGADLTQVSMHGIFLILQDAFDRAFEQDVS